MADWEWPTLKDKFEAIGYLAVPGVISAIEATVPRGKSEQFKKEYDGKFSEEYPYEADKYGKQFRIYLNDTEGCPDVLRENIDGRYNNRINNTHLIDELVKEYGFRFTKEPQNGEFIREIVANKCGRPALDAFDKGYFGYREFVQDIENLVKTERDLSKPNMLEYEEKPIARTSGRKSRNGDDNVSGFTPNQMLKLGWVGEEYIAYLLRIRDEALLKSLGISANADYTVDWFNEGVQNIEEKPEFPDFMRDKTHIEYVKKWDDKSVGRGCDLTVTDNVGTIYYLEVKTSKRSYPYFNMTSVEMQEMEIRGHQYNLIKINNIERLLRNESPDIIIINNPYEKIFHPAQMKEATFIVGGK